ncbi:oxobutanoate dehydrogenase [lipoamide] kinase, mitochondrial [Seminavis robusta]|uniref:Protein-serine/threonine kinase n=1 Tax=Seminavis robusta TaxID=568900 RepID=A0A9N8DFJ8_9STRA|nr:oxobutanoate dehydrogenase [lipoamide] kinase, mitochondrial [Seminavis robusta]|eukprot:Sro125_g060310.1 oxobutanoate dehydrogenase [lipoamide]] kinase, mitochondrial (450) ;mRNA; r:77145-78628
MIRSIAANRLRICGGRKSSPILAKLPVRQQPQSVGAERSYVTGYQYRSANKYSSVAALDDEVRSYDTIPEDVMELVEEYCQKKQTPVSMHALVKAGRHSADNDNLMRNGSLNQYSSASGKVLIQAANFLCDELPVRLAHRINDLDKVPFMRDMPSVQLVKGIYINSFVDLVRYGSIATNEDEAAFAHFLNKKYEKHANVLIQMARGAYELRQQQNDQVEFSQLQDCHEFLDRFYMSRIGIRVLAGQYLALRQTPLPDYIGMICLRTSPYELVRQAARDATKMCQRKYGEAPEVQINGRTDLTFPYIPTYLHYILLELLKNAMRATVERHSDATGRALPPVQVIVADEHDNEDVVIKVADVGGGIPRSNLKKVWSYLFTTADPKIQEDFIGDRDHDAQNSPLAGLGFGLPISRSYARYFNGELTIMSMEGWGTDAYVHLARLEDPDQEFS